MTWYLAKPTLTTFEMIPRSWQPVPQSLVIGVHRDFNAPCGGSYVDGVITAL